MCHMVSICSDNPIIGPYHKIIMCLDDNCKILRDWSSEAKRCKVIRSSDNCLLLGVASTSPVCVNNVNITQ